MMATAIWMRTAFSVVPQNFIRWQTHSVKHYQIKAALFLRTERLSCALRDSNPRPTD